MTYDETIMTV